jgi:ribosomal protein S18 acetylase RimI-like enzyme
MSEMPDISYRPIAAAELPFLGRLYASTREEELAITGWPREQIDALLAQQFAAQHKHYTENYPGASFDLVLVSGSGEAIDRLYLDRRETEFRIIDISLLPEWRGRGIGGAILRELLTEADGEGKAVTIHVEAHNPAMSLYLRLGFRHVDDKGVYHLMKWTASG